MIGNNSIEGAALRSFIERIERLEESKKEITDDIKDVFSEAKAHGFEVKIMRELLRLRKMEEDVMKERNSMLTIYAHAIGMQLEMDI